MITTVSPWLCRFYATNIQQIKDVRENTRISSKGFFVGMLFFLLAFTGFSQTEFRIDPNQDQVQSWANEVYRDCPEYASSAHVEIYTAQAKKVSIVEVADLSNRYNITELSSVGLKNKCNPDLDYESGDSFSPENFNPLKYFFDFNASEDQMYLVNGTHYIITISK